MLLKQVYIKNFRCFAEQNFVFEGPLVLIEGLNGAGKTSLLEALHYLCYLRSFRTHSPRELLLAGENAFFVKAAFITRENDTDTTNELQVGFSRTKRLVKINQKVICSYKELLDFYRIVTLTEDDLFLIKGSPEIRRSFIDQAILLYDPQFAAKLRLVRQVADNRNKLLHSGSIGNRDFYDVLTMQLWQASQEVQASRKSALAALEKAVKDMLVTHFKAHLEVSIAYKAKLIDDNTTYDDFMAANPMLYADEQRYGRSLFGAHLDDFTIICQQKQSKNFASRGQQKLIILLIKIAQIRELLAKKGPAIFLLDDFMTDFDEQRADIILSVLIDLKCQLIFTSPARIGSLGLSLARYGVQKLVLTC